MKTKKLIFYFAILFALVALIFSSNIYAQSNQELTVGIESTTIFTLFPGYYTQTNASYDSIVISSLYSSLIIYILFFFQ